MTLYELILIAVGLSMDAFAVSVCKGLSAKKVTVPEYLCVGAWFGGFQALMPLIGSLLGVAFEKYIVAVDHWIAFGLLGAIGVNMIREAVSGEEEEVDASFAAKSMFPMALATSIDALAVGITLGLLPGTRILPSVLLIGATTFSISAFGLWAGRLFGDRLKNKAGVLGGVILIVIGLKILLEHLGILSL